ncbi:MAG: hypothetical protein ACYCVN_12870 [Acidimicrobiales bacterium]
MTELRMVVPTDIVERTASEAAERGTSTEDVAAEVLQLHVPASTSQRRRPRFAGKGQCVWPIIDPSERVEEIPSADLGS